MILSSLVLLTLSLVILHFNITNSSCPSDQLYRSQVDRIGEFIKLYTSQQWIIENCAHIVGHVEVKIVHFDVQIRYSINISDACRLIKKFGVDYRTKSNNAMSNETWNCDLDGNVCCCDGYYDQCALSSLPQRFDRLIMCPQYIYAQSILLRNTIFDQLCGRQLIGWYLSINSIDQSTPPLISYVERSRFCDQLRSRFFGPIKQIICDVDRNCCCRPIIADSIGCYRAFGEYFSRTLALDYSNL